MLTLGFSRYMFRVSSVCNNMMQNSVTVTYDETLFDMTLEPTAEVIKTMAPLRGMFYSRAEEISTGVANRVVHIHFKMK